ncbi:MAG: methionine--tRNA ligase, partial [Thermodesulfobacteriota bacterium]
MKKLITSALPYVNNVPHLGNIIGCVLSADVYARFCRLRGYETLYVCGTDEYGTATENKAREEGLTPEEICNKYHEIHKNIYKNFNISFDIFDRTSTKEQTETAQSIFNDLDQNNLIKEQTTKRSYCEHDKIFLADRYVEGTCPFCSYDDARGDQCDKCGKLLEPESLKDPRCKICGNRPVLKETSHLYLKLDEIQDDLENWFEKSSVKGKWSNNAVRTTRAWLDLGLQPRPITRDLSWGIPVPRKGYENKVFYVWFDAPIGYISMTYKNRTDWKDWWQNPDNVQLYQFMAKDNIPFHTVIFPSSLIGTKKNWTLLHHINATEYLNYENTKFSKSNNIGVFGNDVKDTGIDMDLWRFYLLANRPERTDSDFTWDDFIEKINSEFIDNIGNLVNRTLTYLKKNFDGEIKDFELNSPHLEFTEECIKDIHKITDLLENVKIREAARLILALGNRGNKFFQDMVPWEKIKTDKNHAHTTVSVLAYLTRNLAVAISPYMPETSDKILTILNIKKADWNDADKFAGLDGHKINNVQIIHKKLEPQLAEEFRKKYSGDRPEFGKLQLKAAEITDVKKHPNAEHLYHLTVDAGEERKRSIAAGLVKHYSPEDLMNKKVIILANLKPAELQGVMSEGMVLVCKKKKKMELLDSTGFEKGDLVEVENQVTDHREIEIDDFKNTPLVVKNGKMVFDENKVCSIKGVEIETHNLKSGKVC